MKSTMLHTLVTAAVLLAATLASLAQSATFTYQGRLTENGAAANGTNDFTFTLYNAGGGGATVGASNVVADLAVINGLFTVTLDFGAAVFDGSARWLQIAVRPGASAGAYTNLTPRQPITTAPYALRALSADNANNATTATTVTAGGVGNLALASDAVDGAKILNGSITSADLNASLLNNTFWNLGGNAGTTPGAQYLGTTDNQPLDFRVKGTRGLRLEPTASTDTVNLIGGSAHNFVGTGVVGATIGGGGGINGPNSVLSDFGVVVGGGGNTIQTNAQYAAIGGGAANWIEANAQFATIGGGRENTIQTNGQYGTIGGGWFNRIQTNANFATIGGGNQNTAYGNYATVAGGVGNTAGGQFSFAAGHDAKALHDGTFVWADSPAGSFSSTGNNQFLIRAAGGVGINKNNPATALDVNGAVTATSMSFGTQIRQMLNLWGTNYGLGVQASSLYFRCDNASGTDGFIWYKGGVHNDGYAQPGAGGTELMHLVQGALYVNGALVPSSDRNAKENFAPVNPREVLEKVAALPISRWNFKGDTTTPHVGPMAQDFHAAFGLGTDDKHIATVDADGVALAAIQGLNAKVEGGMQNAEVRSRQFEQRLQEKETEITQLKHELEKLKQVVDKLANANH